MTPYWERRFEPQSPGGRRAVLRLLCVMLTVILVLTLLRPRPFQTIDYVAVGMLSLVLGHAIWGLISIDERGVTVFGRVAERRIAGRRLGDWTSLVVGALGCVGFIRFGDGGFDWLLAGVCAFLALAAGWRMVRSPATQR
jgi:hypothetical protein